VDLYGSTEKQRNFFGESTPILSDLGVFKAWSFRSIRRTSVYIRIVYFRSADVRAHPRTFNKK
jgi:hypothetical protein